jgi:hypothetical protein
MLLPANQLGAIVSMAVAGTLASSLLRGLDVSVAGLHLGRIDSIFLVSGLLIVASGAYFAVATRALPDTAAAAVELPGSTA